MNFNNEARRHRKLRDWRLYGVGFHSRISAGLVRIRGGWDAGNKRLGGMGYLFPCGAVISDRELSNDWLHAFG